MTKEQYESLQVEKKAEICARMLDGDCSGFGVSCKLGEDGRYHFESAHLEEFVERFEAIYANSHGFARRLAAL